MVACGVKQNTRLKDNDFVTETRRTQCDERAKGLLMSLQGWKKEIYSRWDELNMESVCKEFEIDFEETFLNPLINCTSEANPFEGLQFTWMPNSVIHYGVLHLHPIEAPATEVTWEEWFIHTDGLHHHVLRNYEFEEATDNWKGEDSDHPVQVSNIQWHLFNDTNLIPLPLR